MWRRNGLSIALAVLFAVTLLGHSVSGWKYYNHEQQEHGDAQVGYREFLGTSEFGETVFENWESEFLQMAAYILLTVVLFQKGSSESKDPDGRNDVDEDPRKHRNDPNAPSPVRRGGWQLALYRNSLALAFVLMFLVSFAGHAWAGARKQTAQEREHGSPETITVMEYMRGPQFWYESFQNWQSEFLSVLAIVLLSIHLRQFGSPESKPVHASHGSTGE